MRSKLEAALNPTKLVIDNESAKHAGHAGAAGAASGESHFAVEVVSGSFVGLNSVKRHRLVYSLLGEEFGRGLHALSLNPMTPDEVEVR